MNRPNTWVSSRIFRSFLRLSKDHSDSYLHSAAATVSLASFIGQNGFLVDARNYVRKLPYRANSRGGCPANQTVAQYCEFRCQDSPGPWICLQPLDGRCICSRGYYREGDSCLLQRDCSPRHPATYRRFEPTLDDTMFLDREEPQENYAMEEWWRKIQRELQNWSTSLEAVALDAYRS